MCFCELRVGESFIFVVFIIAFFLCCALFHFVLICIVLFCFGSF